MGKEVKEHIVEVVNEVVERWNREESGELAEDHPRHLAFSTRQLEEMEPSSKLLWVNPEPKPKKKREPKPKADTPKVEVEEVIEEEEQVQEMAVEEEQENEAEETFSRSEKKKKKKRDLAEEAAFY